MAWLREHRGLEFADYDALWTWSVSDTPGFWSALWEFFAIDSTTPYERVVDQELMQPGNTWFAGSQVNFAEHVLRAAHKGPAIWHLSESRALAALSWDELTVAVRKVATQFRALGVEPGDCVVSLLPNIPETAIAMLAAISIGAVWSNAAPEFGSPTIRDRFTQLDPKVLLAADGYGFGGKAFDRREQLEELIGDLPTLETLIFLPYVDADAAPPRSKLNLVLWSTLLQTEDPGGAFEFERVGPEHPLWVVFSSGTTGLPKAIVHNHVGVLIEMYKFMALHLNLGEDDTAFFYTTTGWVMFNLVVGMLLTGSAVVLYDGSPAYPDVTRLWSMAAESGATLFGASPGYVKLMEDQGVVPKDSFDLSAMKSVLVGGAPSTPETFAWFYDAVKSDLWVTSQSGGTEIASGFVGGSPTLPVYAGEIQTRALGMAVDAWSDERKPLVGEVGELVCTKPFPSMPIYFMNDDDGRRYRAAYFEDIPGVWRHGDFLEINERGGCYIYGRSDSTLNRNGVRIGTAEVYRVVEAIDEVADSLVVCVERPGQSAYMPLFLQLAPGSVLTDELQETLREHLKTRCSARHVPDEILAVDEIPYTLTGKKLEVPVQRLLAGWTLEKSVSRSSMRNPEAIDYFVELGTNRT